MKTCELCDRQNSKCGISTVSQSRVVNGEEAKEGAWPWIASLQISRYGVNQHFCGGTILTPKWVEWSFIILSYKSVVNCILY